MRLDSEINDRLNWNEAVSRELSAHNRFLPPVWGDVALRRSADAVAQLTQSRLGRLYRVEQEIPVLARKQNRGARPLARLGLTERIGLRALTDLIASTLDLPGRTENAYGDFERTPLDVADVRYVLKTDIASYYEYVDHERLVDEVVAQTADVSLVARVVELLSESSGRTFGLPQMNDASDVLAEIYIEPMRRRLVRAGGVVSRFADDFRIACSTYEDAIAMWEEADEAARSLGLVLSETKTRIVGIDKYRESVVGEVGGDMGDDVDDDGDEEFSMWELDDTEYWNEPDQTVWSAPVTGVDRDEVDPQDAQSLLVGRPSEVDQQIAEAFIGQLMAARRQGDTLPEAPTGLDAHVFLRRSLQVLIDSANPSALPSVAGLLVFEPSATPSLAAYLRSCADDNQDEVLRVMAEISRSRFASVWQSIWLAFVLGDLRPGAAFEHNDLANWLRHLSRSKHPALAAECILSLARRRWVDRRTIVDVLDRLPAVHRSTAVIALGALGEASASSAVADSVLDGLRAQWALDALS